MWRQSFGRLRSRLASPGPKAIAGPVARVLSCLGVIASVSGCDFNYQPQCATSCLAGGGDEYIGASGGGV